MNFFRKRTVVERDDLVELSEPFACPEFIEKPSPLILSDTDQVKYEEVLKHFRDEKLTVAITEAGNGESKPLTRLEKLWLTRECLMRYLRATKGNVKEAIERLEYTIAWRREFGISGNDDKFTADTISHENKTGKQVLLGYDKSARPLLYFKPGRQNTRASIKQVQSTVWFLERAIDVMPLGQEKLALLIDFKSHKVEGEASKIPSLSLGKQVLHILQSHYPERLGKALFIHLPLVATTFLKLIGPFLDPVTKEKLVYDTEFGTVVDDSQLDSEYEGQLKFAYHHEVYYDSLVKLCDGTREHMIQRFDQLGGVVGLSEYDLKGNDEAKFPV